MAGWSLLPKDLLERISGGFESCFEIVHFRSVCSSWRSSIHLPSYWRHLGYNSLLPIFNDNPRFEGDKHCILKKIPFFLLRYQTPFDADYLVVGMSESKSGKQKLRTLFQDLGLTCKYGIVLNTLSSQIISLGHYYKIKFYAASERHPRLFHRCSERVAFLQMDKEFAVVAKVLGDLMMYRSVDKKWTEIEGEFESYQDIISYKGKFYVLDMSGRGHVFVIEPSSLKVSEIHAIITQSDGCSEEKLVVSGDELLLVQRFTPGAYGCEYKHTWFRLFRLQEEGQRRIWVRFNDLEDRVIFLGFGWNLCYSAKELPGMKRNFVLFVLPNNVFDGILFFDLATKRTSIGSFGETLESPMLCGILTLPNPGISIYDSSSESELGPE